MTTSDKKGRELKEGQIIKTFHFSSRGRNYWMYKIIAIKDGELRAMDIKELYDLGRDKAHTCRLEHLSEDTEIISGD